MRFKKGKQGNEMPHVDLVPMMDVILTILTFFILASLTLTRQQAVDVTLPSASAGATEQNTPDPLVVGLNQQRQVLLENKPVSDAQLAQQMQTYLVQNPKGAVILKADRKLPYEEVVQVLGKMRDIGGDRVSLAIEQS
jgi:biopolymer transport protein ExbD